MTPHLPRHRLEELVVDQGDAAQRAHLDTCAECAARLRSLSAARAAFLEHREPTAFARELRALRVAKKGVPMARWLTAGALAVAAAVLLFSLRGTPASDAIRLKGSRRMQMFVQRHGRPEALEDGQPLAAGDQLAFAYSLPEARHLLLLSIDDTGVVTRYYPTEERGSAPLAPTARAQLPVGIELDAHRGEERLVALFSREPIDETKAREALRAALHEAQARGAGIAGMGRVALLAEQASVWFQKP